MSVSILRSFQTKGEDRQVQQTFTGKLTNGNKAWSSVYGCFEWIKWRTIWLKDDGFFRRRNLKAAFAICFKVIRFKVIKVMFGCWRFQMFFLFDVGK